VFVFIIIALCGFSFVFDGKPLKTHTQSGGPMFESRSWRLTLTISIFLHVELEFVDPLCLMFIMHNVVFCDQFYLNSV
jgi:hypothetical protein